MSSPDRSRRSLLLVLCVIAALSMPAGTAAAPAVSAFPIPGSRVATLHTQIAFRGVPAGQLGTILVTGSVSGVHTGKVEADSDSRGGSFLPAKGFKAGEVVTVTTTLNVIGARNGTFTFTICNPPYRLPPFHWPAAARTSGDVWHFRSRPDLQPAAVMIDKHGHAAPGYVFLAPQYGPLQDGPEIVDSNGNLVWFKRLSGDDSASNFRVQTYRGRNVLTWWQGYVNAGVGVGEDVIADSAYQVINVVRAANGLQADHHEFQISPQNTALITVEHPVWWDASSVHGSTRQVVFDAIVQEIDIPTGLLLFQWDSLDHVPLSYSYTKPPRHQQVPYDYFHANSIDVDRDGNLIVSSRNTSASYKIDRATGRIIWTLGGKHSSFRMGPGASFAYQHDVRIRSLHDSVVTLFDDGGNPRVHSQSRGLKLSLDTRRRYASVIGQQQHLPPLAADYEGNYQQLPDGHTFLGWGQQPYFSEYDARGRQVFDGHFYDFIASYRAYRFRWYGLPHTLPALSAFGRGRTTYLFASWNGATDVVAWRIQAGRSRTSLHTISTVHKRGFETPAKIARRRFVRVVALNHKYRPLAASAIVRAG